LVFESDLPLDTLYYTVAVDEDARENRWVNLHPATHQGVVSAYVVRWVAVTIIVAGVERKDVVGHITVQTLIYGKAHLQ
jgi:hypothetical protein